ncbi:MAG: 4-hydroxy-tetrahydrodipicolinate reductase [Coriobacteriales bacterium]|nr:4-hydroxy-tetrahydrodipicolinate reductase [Coriobacteriales bacterium]
MIKVLICGIKGRMGSCTAKAVEQAPDMELVGGVDRIATQKELLEMDGAQVPVYAALEEAIDILQPQVMVDFTHPSAVAGNLRIALPKGIDCVVGTTGLSPADQAALATIIPAGTGLFIAPNFTTGAVLMMKFAQMAAKYFPDAEVLEFHHCHKADSPSGTAVRTARMIAAAQEVAHEAPGSETELPGMEGARGALVDGVPVHSIRTTGHVAHQEVIFGSKGQTLTIRHDSIDRESSLPGVLLAIRKVGGIQGLVVGLENLMD